MNRAVADSRIVEMRLSFASGSMMADITSVVA
jgi:hypothetical protein